MNKVDNEVIEKCINGDEKAFEVIFDTYKNSIYFFAYEFFKDKHIAEDIVQDTFIAVYKNIKSLKNYNTFSAWLYKIAYHCCIKKTRKKKLVLRYDNDDITVEDYSDTKSISDPSIIIHNQNIQDILRQCIDSLSLPLKSVCILRFYEELSISEISKVLDISEGTVKSRLNRAKHILSASLINQGITPQDYNIDTFQSIVFPCLSMVFKELSTQATLSFTNPTTAIQILHKSKSILVKQVLSILGIGSVATALIIVPLMKQKEAENIKITDIHYNTAFTNQTIVMDVKSSIPYDYFTINDKETNSIEDNGLYTITIYKNNKAQDTRQLTISNIDREAPQQVNVIKSNNIYTIYYQDNLSNINPSSIKLTKNNEEIEFIYDEQSKAIVFETEQDNDYIIEICDYAGNVAITTSKQKEYRSN